MERWSLKDAVIVSEDEFYLGTNNGVVKAIKEGEDRFETEPVSGFKSRTYSIAYNATSKCLYVSASDGVFVSCHGKEKKKITYDHEDIFPNSLCYHSGKVYASTKNDGLLVIEEDKVSSVILPIADGRTEELKKVIIHNNTIVGNSANGLFQFNMDGKLLRSVHASFRFTGKKIMDFSFGGDDLWVSHSGGVQKVSLELDKSNIDIPPIRIDKILVNDNEVSNLHTGDLKSNERKITFIVSSPTLRNRGNVHYKYRLTGYETTWNVNNYQFNRITYNALAPGTYSLEVMAVNQGKYSKTIRYLFTIARPLYLRWYFILGCVILFILAVLFVYRWQLSIQRKKSEQINELNVSKLTAIQSQMNPHFIFNSLNSIQDLILKGDVEKSYSYIATFSNLVRRTLNYSDKDFIDFEQEIKLLELYLSLEKLRFKRDLTYSIETNGIVDIQIPPMLIQPFIENALAHGLLHLEGEKKLRISFALNDVLTCIVEDNGVGRDRSKTIAQRSGHESFSGNAIHKRFEILSSALGGCFNYFYEDLYEDRKATGTRVVITIPVRREY